MGLKVTVRPKKALSADTKRPIANKGSSAPTQALITPSGRFMALDTDKLRGGYYTPAPVARWLAEWAIRSADERILEPSCGDGNLIIASMEVLASLGATSDAIGRQVSGVELTTEEAAKARNRAAAFGDHCSEAVVVDDFFGWFERRSQRSDSGHLYDVAIGNPPFIRYQSFPEPARTRAMSLMSAAGLKPNKLTNVWVPFVVAAVQSLRKGGRLAFVIPAELLQVTYAAQLRKLLTQRFDSITLVSCNELFFEGAEQEVLLLLAEGARAKADTETACQVRLVERKTVADVVATTPRGIANGVDDKAVCGDSEKWLKYFLTASEIQFMRELRLSQVATTLSHFASVDVGVVTGKNKFFVLSQADLRSLNIEGCFLKLASRSAHLRGAIFSESDWQKLYDADERVALLNIRSDMNKLTESQTSYISDGERHGYHLGYKCSIRSPWYHVPSIWTPDGFLFRQIYDFPRFIRNDAHACSTDTIHRLTVHGCTADALISSAYTYMTAASAEIEGRSYGGGVLELEPTEAERLLVPANVDHALPLTEMDSLLRHHGVDDLLRLNSHKVLTEGLGLSRADVKRAESIWIKMRDRRRDRGRRAR
ncbi:N-6 DNA methylase [Sphingomonas sp.]|uniref:N-6 DNA methylase n=1 Tax=Sphingomonas sp. TaxID=28214 RepID=UPI0035C7B406